MDAITDPRIREIMAKLNKTEEQSTSESPEDTNKKEPEHIKPPSTYEEFLKSEKLDEWPQKITSENLLDLTDERDLLGSKDAILKELQEATMLDTKVLRDLENRLQRFERSINAAADMMVVNPAETEEDGSAWPMSVNKIFMTEAKEGDMVKVHPSRKKKQTESDDPFLETRKRSVEHCSFPGYRQGELTELPAQLEAPQLLNRVTKAQDFSSGFRKFWKKIFQSEASVAMMQDTFWWIFIYKFEEKSIKDQSKLFDRVCDSFVALFNSVNPEIKDKVFSVYADCLAQAIYIAFKEAFPDSEHHFQNSFKQELIDIFSQWITGIRSHKQSWKDWDLKRLQPRSHHHTSDSKTQLGSNPRDTKSLDLTEFQNAIQHLQSEDQLSSTTAPSHDVKLAVHTPGGAVVPVPVSTMPPMAVSRQAICGSPLKKSHEQSHKMGPGPEMERVMFSLHGRSPLVTHFLQMRQLQTNQSSVVRKMKRTQMAKPQTESENGPTYQDLIRETTHTQEQMGKEYRKICHMTQHEIHKIERQQRETTRRIEQLQKDMTYCRSSMEIKLMGESILKSRDWDTDDRQTAETKALLQKDKDENSENFM